MMESFIAFFDTPGTESSCVKDVRIIWHRPFGLSALLGSCASSEKRTRS